MPSRRGFVLGTLGVAGAVVVGWSLLPPRQRLHTATPLPVGNGQVALNGWVKIASDNSVTVMMAKSEMGQGVFTALAMLLAEELDADWAQVRVEGAPVDKIYNNLATVVDGLPFHPDDGGKVKQLAGWLTAKTMREIGVMVTGGSSSIKDLWLPMRQAGASARALMIGAAAQQWALPAAECRVADGRVSHPSGRSASFGELAALAAKLPLPKDAALKDPKAFKLIGKPVPRIDNASKTDGTARFGIDVVLPGMLYASASMCPTRGGRVARFDAGAAQKMPGVKTVLKVDAHNGCSEAVAVIADTPFHAMQAVKQVSMEWAPGAAADFSSEQAFEQMARALDKEEEGHAFHEQGDVKAAMQGAAKTLTAEYRAPYLAHAQMEPNNCTVQFKDGTATVWAPTQVPGVARNAVAQALGIAAEKVDVQVQFLGGGFGRRLDVDFIAQAAAIARAAEGMPVQTFWSREQDMKNDFYRPACLSRFKAGFDAQGKLVAWQNTSAGQAITPQVLRRAFDLPGGGPDKTASEGAFDQPYEFTDARIAHASIELPAPVGFWRAVGHSHQAFFKEGFMDEAAHAAGQDPVAFRAALLQQPRHARHLAVLRLAAQKAGWDTPLTPAGDGAKKARGVALHQSFGSVVAQVAEVSLGADKGIRVHRVVCAVDCGFPVNPQLIVQQMESGIVFGLSAALFGEITFDKGAVQQSNFHDQPVLRMDQCPVVETHIVPSTEHPEGVGEPGLPPIAPAVANALFALTGQRLRTLPLKLA
jgi:isoquinoline 1-oxidoreductase beta subunit